MGSGEVIELGYGYQPSLGSTSTILRNQRTPYDGLKWREVKGDMIGLEGYCGGGTGVQVQYVVKTGPRGVIHLLQHPICFSLRIL
jgi:hypothetical protein